MQLAAKKAGVAMNGLLQDDPTASTRITKLLGQIKASDLGCFEIFFWASGSGKSTFFQMLARKFPTNELSEIPKDLQLSAVPQYIRKHINPQLWLIGGRDNLTISAEEATDFFSLLRDFFLEQAGQVLLCWPMSDISQAEMLSTIAWQTGCDSICDLNQGLYRFEGPCKSSFYDIADRNTQAFNGHGLNHYGLTHAVTSPLILSSQTIAEFYAKLDILAAKINSEDASSAVINSQAWRSLTRPSATLDS
jgi:hypothetical protein